MSDAPTHQTTTVVRSNDSRAMSDAGSRSPVASDAGRRSPQMESILGHPPEKSGSRSPERCDSLTSLLDDNGRAKAEEVAGAFDFYDYEGHGKISTESLRQRLSVFYPNMPVKDSKLLAPDGEISRGALRNMLLANAPGSYDPVKEAFRVFDVDDTGFVDTEVLRRIFAVMGYGEICDADMEAMVALGDGDGDGRISLQDFRRMVQTSEKQAAPDEQIRRRASLQRAGRWDASHVPKPQTSSPW